MSGRLEQKQIRLRGDTSISTLKIDINESASFTVCWVPENKPYYGQRLYLLQVPYFPKSIKIGIRDY